MHAEMIESCVTTYFIFSNHGINQSFFHQRNILPPVSFFPPTHYFPNPPFRCYGPRPPKFVGSISIATNECPMVQEQAQPAKRGPIDKRAKKGFVLYMMFLCQHNDFPPAHHSSNDVMFYYEFHFLPPRQNIHLSSTNAVFFRWCHILPPMHLCCHEHLRERG